MDQSNQRLDSQIVKVARNKRKQVILAGRKTRHFSNFVEFQPDGKARIHASEKDPLILSVTSGEKEYIDTITSSFENIETQPNSRNFIVLERTAAGKYTPVTTDMEPIYSLKTITGEENKISCTFDGANDDKYFTDHYGNVFKFYGNARITNFYTIFGGNTAYFPGNPNSYCLCEPRDFDVSGLKDWTIEFNVKFNSVTTYQHLVDIDPMSDNTSLFHIVMHNDSRMRLWMGAEHAAYYVNSAVVSTDGYGAGFNTSNIYHIAVVVNKTEVRVYVDGKQTFLAQSFADYFNYQLGSLRTILLGTNSLNALIANFQFWPYAKYGRRANLVLGYKAFEPPTEKCKKDTTNWTDFVSYPKFVYFSSFWRSKTDSLGLFSENRIKDIYGNIMYPCWVSGLPRSPSLFPNGGVNTSLPFEKPGSSSRYNRFQFAVDMGDMSSWTIAFYYEYFDHCLDHKMLYVNLDYCISIDRVSGNRVEVFFGNGVTWIISMISLSPVLPGLTHHIAVTFDGETYRLFINGNHEASATLTFPQRLPKPGYIMLGNPFVDNNCTEPAGYGEIIVCDKCLFRSSFTAFPYQKTLSSLEKFYYYDIQRKKMYKGIDSDFVEQPAIFVGEAQRTTSGSTDILRNPISYTVNAECGPISIGGPNTSKISAYAMGIVGAKYLIHNIGTELCKARVDFVIRRNIRGYFPGERLSGMCASRNYLEGPPVSFYGRNGFWVVVSWYPIVSKSDRTTADAVNDNVSASNNAGDAEVFIERIW